MLSSLNVGLTRRRRVCPGKLLGEASVFIFIATLLAAFTILPPEGEALVPEYYEAQIVRCVDGCGCGGCGRGLTSRGQCAEAV